MKYTIALIYALRKGKRLTQNAVKVCEVWEKWVCGYLRVLSSSDAITHTSNEGCQVVTQTHTHTHKHSGTHTHINAVALACGNINEAKSNAKKHQKQQKAASCWPGQRIVAEAHTHTGRHTNTYIHMTCNTNALWNQSNCSNQRRQLWLWRSVNGRLPGCP